MDFHFWSRFVCRLLTRAIEIFPHTKAFVLASFGWIAAQSLPPLFLLHLDAAAACWPEDEIGNALYPRRNGKRHRTANKTIFCCFSVVASPSRIVRRFLLAAALAVFYHLLLLASSFTKVTQNQQPRIDFSFFLSSHHGSTRTDRVAEDLSSCLSLVSAQKQPTIRDDDFPRD